jgi:hypothetical protein
LTFFRTNDLAHAFQVVGIMFSKSLFTIPYVLAGYKLIVVVMALFLIVEWFQREKQHGLDIKNLPLAARWASYYVIVAVILYFSFTRQEETPFIYFQF